MIIFRSGLQEWKVATSVKVESLQKPVGNVMYTSSVQTNESTFEKQKRVNTLQCSQPVGQYPSEINLSGHEKQI